MENTDFPLNFVIFVLQNPGFNKWKAWYTSVFEVEKKTETNVFELSRYCGEWIPYYFCLKNKASW